MLNSFIFSRYLLFPAKLSDIMRNNNTKYVGETSGSTSSFFVRKIDGPGRQTEEMRLCLSKGREKGRKNLENKERETGQKQK